MGRKHIENFRRNNVRLLCVWVESGKLEKFLMFSHIEDKIKWVEKASSIERGKRRGGCESKFSCRNFKAIFFRWWFFFLPPPHSTPFSSDEDFARHNFVVRDERLKIKYSQEPKKASMQQPGLVPFDKSIRSSMFDESPDALAIRGGRRGNENFRSAFMRFSPRAISFVSTDDATLCASVLS